MRKARAPRDGILIARCAPDWQVFCLPYTGGDRLRVRLTSAEAEGRTGYTLSWSRSLHDFATTADSRALRRAAPDVLDALREHMQANASRALARAPRAHALPEDIGELVAVLEVLDSRAFLPVLTAALRHAHEAGGTVDRVAVGVAARADERLPRGPFAERER